MFNKVLNFFSLFGSLSTLLCCALPVTLVSIGMGATFASLTSNFPQVIWLIERKTTLFIITAFLLALSYFMMKRADRLSCPIDPEQKAVCEATKPLAWKIFWVSILFYFVGLLFSYILPLFLF